ncbi:hypothetical protein BDN72DRAFT_837737 [Pluteus cervinus]|uniref:Uncharacterized protein n=1 Tax=Pluteus cervinus TaxID=181527 RepID=A0ACD3B152_9AGAR|nr:hypothetical protein BDN72DRAFT_837737 [Pluteus cervinus]
MFNQSGSRRWTHFRSALELAIERSAHKWTYEDFAQCFPTYVEEDKTGAVLTFTRISDYIKNHNLGKLDELLQEYDAKENIDALHKIVTEAQERKAAGQEATRKDVWNEDIQPSVAVAARTLPMFQKEADRATQTLESLKKENLQLMAALEEEMATTTKLNQQSLELLNLLSNANKAWEEIPLEDVEKWTVEMNNYIKPTL